MQTNDEAAHDLHVQSAVQQCNWDRSHPVGSIGRRPSLLRNLRTALSRLTLTLRLGRTSK